MDNLSGSHSDARIVNGEDKNQNATPPVDKSPAGQKRKRNIIAERFRANAIASFGPIPFTPKEFFFYGSLMDPVRLQEVLQLPTTPVLKPAHVTFHQIMLWGQYPALVHGTVHSVVNGMAYLVETKEQQRMLEHYETKAYCVQGVRIIIDGKAVPGRTFAWARDISESTEGTWSLEEWKNGVEEEMASHFLPLRD